MDISYQHCKTRFPTFAEKNFNEAINGTTFYQRMREMAPTLDNITSDCSWLNTKVDCSDLFREIITEEGICYNFNSFPSEKLLRKEM
jgi:hypothetical protein